MTSTTTTLETTNCQLPPGAVFASAWINVLDEIGCASEQALSGQVVEQNFISGKMVWREPLDYGRALVFFNSGVWRTYYHAPYSEGDPEFPCVDEYTPAQSPPTPKRGFGAMWCDIPEIRSGLGNATDGEYSFTGAMQRFENGSMLHTAGGATVVFYDNGLWEWR
ncbi:MAG: hypothetical protein ACK2U6_15460 [Candidatus Promineifilaceae bacterium]